MLNLTKSERRALVIISGVMLVSLVIQWTRPHKGNSKIYDYSLQDSLFKVLSADTIKRQLVHAEQVRARGTFTKPEKKTLPKRKSINLNMATEKQLQQLPRIGPATAKLIIEYRKQNGPFHSIRELDNVKRIGPKTIEKIEPFIYVEKDSI